MLYLIEILHQTTTSYANWQKQFELYLIEILHQTTTSRLASIRLYCCILSKFYIKPQQRHYVWWFCFVVSYRNSTSNHNSGTTTPNSALVVSYRNSTSNHNNKPWKIFTSLVVSYRNSTSNHNFFIYLFTGIFVVSYRNSTSNHNCA